MNEKVDGQYHDSYEDNNTAEEERFDIYIGHYLSLLRETRI